MKPKAILALLLLSTAILSACQKNETTLQTTNQVTSNTQTTTEKLKATSNTKEKLYGDYKETDYNQKTTAIDTTITLKEKKATISGKGVKASDGKIEITAGGNYLIKGNYQGQIQVNTKETVHLILENLTIENETGPAIKILESKQTVVTLAPETTNTISDGTKYENGEEETSVIFSKSDLTFNGTGTLNVTGNYKNAIQSKANLTFIDGKYQIVAENQGLKGKDKVAILAGTFEIETKSGDAIQASNDTDVKKGFVAIDGGNFTIQSGSDGIQAETNLYFQGEKLELTTKSEVEVSLKGLKAGNELIINEGKLALNTMDDSLHSNGNLTINGGEFTITSLDDGAHSDKQLTIHNGKINIAKSYEGLEASHLVINGGEIEIYATDDGINAATSSSDETKEKSSSQKVETPPSDGENKTGEFGGNQVPPERNQGDFQEKGQAPGAGGGPMEKSDGSLLEINGGKLTVSAAGDGIDSNGDIIMKGGEVTVFGPENGGNGTLDYSGNFTMTGGSLFGIGSSGMVQTVSKENTQKSFDFYLNQVTTAKKVTVSQNQQILLEVTPTKKFQHLLFSNEKLALGEIEITIDNKTYSVNLTEETNSFNQDGSAYTNQGKMGQQPGR